MTLDTINTGKQNANLKSLLVHDRGKLLVHVGDELLVLWLC